jgi:biopolymer transport protein ExbD
MAKQKASKQKKMNVRVDFTPMVDMMMLLITFFMLCTSLSKPQTMELTMPSNDKNIQQQDQTATKASQTITIYVCGDNKIFHVDGLPNYNDPKCMKETTWGAKGIRTVLINHETEDGSTPVQAIMAAKAKLDAKKIKEPKKYTEQVYDDELTKIKNGELDGEKVPTMTIIIKATDNASYKNMVDALDEMQICSIGKYVIDKITPDDLKLIKAKGAK